MTSPIIRITNLHHTYQADSPTPVLALRGVSLDIQPGEYIVLLGHNGCGKSTLAKHLNALLLPTEGDVFVNDWNTREQDRWYDIRSTVGMVFQTPDNQFVATIVEEDVAFGPENLNIPRAEIINRVDWALDRVDMLPYRHRAPHLLSGGQKQRICVAGVLAMKPRVLVFDEATAMLDPLGRREVLAVARRMNQEEGVTVIAITHFMEEALDADRVIVMEDGQIALQGTPREVFSRVEELHALQLDVPQISQLAARLQAKTPDFPGHLLTVDELIDAVRRRENQTPQPPLPSAMEGSLAGKGEPERSTPPPFPGEGPGERSDQTPQPPLPSAMEGSLPGKGEPERSTPPPFVGEGPGERSDLTPQPPSLPGKGESEERFSPPPFVGEGQGERSTPPPFPGEGQGERSSSPLITVKNLAHYYMQGTPLQVQALFDVNVEVRRGEVLGIIGHTGSGKSSVVQHFNGLLRPHAGEVVVLGQNMRHVQDIKAIRRRVGLVFQSPEAQLFENYVGDDIAYGPRNLKLSKEEVRERVRRAMEAVGLNFETFKDRLTFALSGGQMRRVALAGVLALEPEILVLDEPTSGLDPRGREQMLANILSLRERGVTLVLISHNMEELARVCDRICVISDGRTIMSGTPSQIFAQADKLHGLGLGVPAVTDVMARLMPDAGVVLTVDQAAHLLQTIIAQTTS